MRVLTNSNLEVITVAQMAAAYLRDWPRPFSEGQVQAAVEEAFVILQTADSYVYDQHK
jgi:hypothetical protein